MLNYYRYIVIFFIALLCTACGHGKSAASSDQTMVVSDQTNTTSLFFNGTIEPINLVSVTAASDGSVTAMHFAYGENINNHQLLLVVASPQLASDYQSALGEYLKTKKEYGDNQLQMQGTEELHHLKIMSEDDYRLAKSQNYDVALAYIEAVRKLEAIMTKIGVPAKQFEQLNIADIAAVKKALSQRTDILSIYAPATGVALLPEKSGDSSDGSAGQALTVGSQIKSGQSLLMVGDMSGLAIDIKVNEIHINEIKVGQTATVTGDAFPGITLQGKVAHINQQATSDQSSGAATFPVRIIVNEITAAQRKVIHVGMSAKIDLEIKQPATIKVPLAAVFTKNDQTFVKVIDKKSGKLINKPVTTGATDLDSVEINEGLNPGDKVITNANTH